MKVIQSKYYFNMGYFDRKKVFIDIRLHLIYLSLNLSSFDKDMYNLKNDIDKLKSFNSYKRLLKIYDNILNDKIISLRSF